jgi:uncharacterized protein (DUF1499 family)
MSDQSASKFSSRLAATLAITGGAWLATATGITTAQTAEKAPAEASAVTTVTSATRTAALNPLLVCSLPSNCVNSLTSSGLAPLRYVGTGAQGLALLKTTLASFPEARIQLEDDSTVKTIFSTPIGFKDEVIFLIDAQQQQINFQSHSGFGLYDFGKNRSRMQAVAARFAEVAAAAGAK